MHNESISTIKRSSKIAPLVIDWRRHFHRYPELSFKEEKTSKYILDALESMGIYDIQTGIAGHGIVATISSGNGPIIGLRADMDALPIMENTGASFASKHNGIMHACGHDAHMAMLLGAAKLLVEDFKNGKLKGTVKLIFQPAEEDSDEHGLTGAPYFLKSGIINDLDAAIALHVCPWRYAGELQVNKGPSMANIDNFSLAIKGVGGHGGYPHQSYDPIWMSSFVLQGLYGLISRKINPLDVGTLSVGEIKGGTTSNVIPETVQIKGTLRSYTDQIRSQLIKELEAIAKLVEPLGGQYQLDIEHGEPALQNHPEITDLFISTAKSIYPSMEIYEQPFGMGGEDFGHITKEIPGAMFFLGCGKENDETRHLHNSDFMINEEALPIGVTLLTECTHRMLNGSDYFGGEQS
ncbi:M20 metallopeptidase family protein [Aquibacillus rhizosphaerae]|uniref:M20 family metallopeptidase n=1 Tax=Aquibacillus rhizosphaerae TaxID=3051431 RepID=A0ABT7L593_9BACI|nr:M20 family metallopeptidase [Aquibacillus sp. LR5S19]MDL4841038.1 M20 family metallopeptidase [Aquibacillus sp. LR5S19]